MKVFGVNYPCGLGQYARELAKVLDLEWGNLFSVISARNPVDGIVVMGANGPWAGFRGARAVCPFWEFHHNAPKIPYGPILAPSDFIWSMYGGVTLPPMAVPANCQGPAVGEFTALYIFDGKSSVERKCPDAILRAMSGLHRPPKIIIKTNIPKPGRYDEYPNIEWINEYLEPDEYERLWERCTVYVSPHRSEGLGLTLLEAMARGKPIVATAYGGCMDFLRQSFCVFIPYGWGKFEDPHHISYSDQSPIGHPPGVAPVPFHDQLGAALEGLMESRSLVIAMGEQAAQAHRELCKEWQNVTPALVERALA